MRVRPARGRRAWSLGAPRQPARLQFQPHYDPEAFGRFSEAIARFLGTGRYLVFQTAVVTLWLAWNVLFRDREAGFDPYPFILLTLALSLQASYAAPLILLAQNRQAERDRQETERDRRDSSRTQADTEYLARELAAIRLALGEMPTRDYLDDELERLEAELKRLRARLEESSRAAPPRPTTDPGQTPGVTSDTGRPPMATVRRSRSRAPTSRPAAGPRPSPAAPPRARSRASRCRSSSPASSTATGAASPRARRWSPRER